MNMDDLGVPRIYGTPNCRCLISLQGPLHVSASNFQMNCIELLAETVFPGMRWGATVHTNIDIDM